MSESWPNVTDALVIFGITGDLAKKMTFQALYHLEADGLLDCPIIGVAVEDWSVDHLRTALQAALDASGETVERDVFDRLARIAVAKTARLHTELRGDQVYAFAGHAARRGRGIGIRCGAGRGSQRPRLGERTFSSQRGSPPCVARRRLSRFADGYAVSTEIDLLHRLNLVRLRAMSMLLANLTTFSPQDGAVSGVVNDVDEQGRRTKARAMWATRASKSDLRPFEMTARPSQRQRARQFS